MTPANIFFCVMIGLMVVFRLSRIYCEYRNSPKIVCGTDNEDKMVALLRGIDRKLNLVIQKNTLDK